MKYLVVLVFLVLSCGRVALRANDERSLNEGHLATFLGARAGLSQGNVFCVVQDHFGYIWAGTENGLNRFDGASFDNFLFRFDDSDSLSDDWISALHPEASGKLWVGTRFGLDCFDPTSQKFTHYPFESGRREGWCLVRDPYGRLWYGTEEGLFFFDEAAGLVRPYGASPTLNGRVQPVRALLVDGQRLWIGTWGAGLFCRDQQTPPRLVLAEPAGRIRALAQDRVGRLWLGTADGAVVYAPQTQQVEATWLPESEIPAVLVDRDGCVWLGTRGRGLFRVSRDRRRLQGLHDDAGGRLKEAVVWDLLQDRTGMIWFGLAFGRGMGRLPRPHFEVVRGADEQVNGLPDPCVWAIDRDATGALWVGTDSGLLVQAQPGRPWRHLSRLGLVPSARVWAMARTDYQTLWLGAGHAGLVVFDTKTEKSRPVLLPVAGDQVPYVRTLTRDRDGLWVGTRAHGLFWVDLATGLAHSRSLKGTQKPIDWRRTGVFALTGDRQGALLVGTDGAGLIHMDRQGRLLGQWFAGNTTDERRRAERVWALHVDQTDSWWVGLKSGGLAVKHAQRSIFERFTTANSALPDNTVYAVQVDRRGAVWLSTNQGLSRFDWQSDVWSNFSTVQGLQDPEFNLGAVAAVGETFYFGGVKGFNRFDTRAFPVAPIPTAVSILAVDVLDQGHFHHPSLEQPLELAPGVDELKISFARLDFEDPDRVKTAFRLEGVDTDWQHGRGNIGAARYTFLPPGRFRFRVRSTDALGRSVDDEVVLTLDIPPAYYQRTPFKLGVLMLLAALVWLGLRFYSYRQHKTNAWVQEAVENERFSIQEQIHDGPLQLVKKMGLLLEEGRHAGAPTWLASALAELRGSIQQTCFWLLPPSLRLFRFSVAVEEYLDCLRQEPGAPQFDFFCIGDDAELGDALKYSLFSVFQKGMQNVMAHARATHVAIRLKVSSEVVQLELVDDGVGFQTLDSAGVRARGKHFGLICAQERVDALNGRLCLISTPGKGTSFQVVLPRAGGRGHGFGVKRIIHLLGKELRS